MNRALILPAVALVCAAEIGRRCLWMAYPVLTQAWSLVAPRPETKNYEADYLA